MRPNPQTTAALESESPAETAAVVAPAVRSEPGRRSIPGTRAAFLRELERRLALLAREVEGLLAASGVSPGGSEAKATRLLRAIDALGRELAASRSVPDERWSAVVRENLELSWKRLRQSFEELALAGGRRHGSESSPGSRTPRW